MPPLLRSDPGPASGLYTNVQAQRVAPAAFKTATETRKRPPCLNRGTRLQHQGVLDSHRVRLSHAGDRPPQLGSAHRTRSTERLPQPAEPSQLRVCVCVSGGPVYTTAYSHCCFFRDFLKFILEGREIPMCGGCVDSCALRSSSPPACCVAGFLKGPDPLRSTAQRLGTPGAKTLN